MVAYTNDQIADFLIHEDFYAPRKWDSSIINVHYSFLNRDGQYLAETALNTWSDVTGLTFRKTSSFYADITFDDFDSGAYASWSTSFVNGVDVMTDSDVNISTNWLYYYGTQLNGYSFQTYLHEIGHAIGLAHAGHYDGSAIFGRDNHYDNDSWQTTVMSYFAQDENPFTNASFAYVMTPMIADILAIWELYGKTNNLRTGDTTYGLNSNAGGIYDEIARLGGQAAFTIVDDGGYDILDLSNDRADQRVNLNDETYSDVAGLIGNMAIMRDTMIEEFRAGTGNDLVIGNEFRNVLVGNYGNDVLLGEFGDDVLFGGWNDDWLDGGSAAGWDGLHGEGGNDTYLLAGWSDNTYIDEFGANSFGDKVLFRDISIWDLTGQWYQDAAGWGRMELTDRDGDLFHIYNPYQIEGFEFERDGRAFQGFFVGGAGAFNDFISTGNGDDLIMSGSGNDTLFGLGGRDFLRGDDGNDVLVGGSGADILFGGLGDDWLDGSDSDGWDGLHGGEGNDTYLIAAWSDNTYIDEFGASSGGDKILFKDISVWDLNGQWYYDAGGWRRMELFDREGDLFHIYNPEQIELFEFERDNLSFQGFFLGDAGVSNDRLNTGDGNDLIIAGQGDDLLVAMGGDDFLRGDDGNDVLLGEAGADRLFGGRGNDWLDGGSSDGWDGLHGGEGDDTYVLATWSGNTYLDEYGAASFADQILFRGISLWDLTGEWYQDAAGWGRMELTDSDGDLFHIYNPYQFERFEFEVDDLAFNGFFVGGKDGFSDFIQAGIGDDLMLGGAGDDTLFGLQGNDLLRGDAGDDVLIGGAGNDTLSGGSGSDQFVFDVATFDGNDIVTDFELDIDLLSLRGAGFNDLAIIDTNSGARISWETGSVELDGISASALMEDQFLFV